MTTSGLFDLTIEAQVRRILNNSEREPYWTDTSTTLISPVRILGNVRRRYITLVMPTTLATLPISVVSFISGGVFSFDTFTCEEDGSYKVIHPHIRVKNNCIQYARRNSRPRGQSDG